MQRRRLRTALLTVGLACAMTALTSSSWAMTASHYVLRHPKREHCKAHYTKKVVAVKKRIHGHTKTVRETICIHARPKPAPSAPVPQPAPFASTGSDPSPAWTTAEAGPPAWTGEKAPPTIKCTSSSTLAITWRFHDFPPTGENKIREEIKLDRVIIYIERFTFAGPSAENTVTISISPGHHEITVFAHWWGNGAKGQSDHPFKHGIECPGAQGAAPLTPGYWKNHLTEGSPNSQQFLPQSIGSYSVETTTQASAIFAAMKCGNAQSSTQNAIGCLTGHLLATELNLAYGSEPCISATVTTANSWLEGNMQDGVPGVVYAGPYVSDTLTEAQRNEAIALKNLLDKYNNGGGC